MNILMIAPQPFFSSRGTPLSVYYRTKSLSELGHTIDLLTYPFGEDVVINNMKCSRSWRVPFIHDIKIGPSLAKFLLDIPLFFKAVYLVFKKKYDVIYAHEEAVFFCLLFNIITGKKYIYDMHSSLPQQLENFSFTKSVMIKKIFEFLERHSIARASAVITICKELEDHVASLGYKVKNELIQNTLFYPIDFLYENTIDSVDLSNIINTKGRKIVLYAGTFEPYQGIDMYLKSIKIIISNRDDILFVFFGGTPDQLLKMRTRAEELGIAKHTLFTGRINVNIVKNFVTKADVLVSPRLKGTNTPLKIYEYMASGVPIVATNLKTHTQELNEDIAFLRNPEPEDFAMGILECIENEDEAKRRARNAYLLYESKYSESLYKQKLIRILQYVKA